MTEGINQNITDSYNTPKMTVYAIDKIKKPKEIKKLFGKSKSNQKEFIEELEKIEKTVNDKLSPYFSDYEIELSGVKEKFATLKEYVADKTAEKLELMTEKENLKEEEVEKFWEDINKLPTSFKKIIVEKYPEMEDGVIFEEEKEKSDEEKSETA